MAKERNRSSKAPVPKESPAGPTTLRDVPDKLLRLILLHLGSPLWLVHAAATCKRWRRIVVDKWFLREIAYRHRSTLPVAGHYHNHTAAVDGGRRGLTFVPSSPALAVDSRRFTLDFLPGGSRSWEVVDSRGSLLLLAKRKTGGWRRRCLPDLLVCEPVTRRHQVIPRMEEMKYHSCLGVVLHDSGRRREHTTWWEGRTMDVMTRFKVICLLYHEYTGISGGVGTVKAVVFDWGRREKRGWYAKQQHATRRPRIRLRGGMDSLHFIGRAASSLFWSIQHDDSSLLVFDFRWLDEFDILSLPEHIRGTSAAMRVVDTSEDGKVYVVCVQGNNLQVFVTWRNGNSDWVWVLRKSLQLMEATRGLAGYKVEYFRRYATIVSISVKSVVLAPMEETWLFSVDLETMEVMKCKYKTDWYTRMAYPCELPWLPTMHTCLLHCTGRGLGRCSHICNC